MHYLRSNHKDGFSFAGIVRAVLISFGLVATGFTVNAQSCPPNIDFETGTFNNWTCYTGYTSAVGDQNVISLSPAGGPVAGKHTMYSSNTGELDPFGNFPVSCPNGSGHSIKLGSTEAGGQAEGVSYEFTIPANQNSYSLIYNYAVVFQSPNHKVNEQPRMEIEVINVTDNKVITCASFSFIAVGTSLPGFKVSNLSDTINVLYKEWSAVSVDLSGNAGKTIRLFFKTADCTFRRHFGYAYIDVNSECSSTLLGATYCPDDTLINIVAPFGYQSYTWYNSSMTQQLGTQQTLTLMPPPVSGTTFAVKVEPYDGYGCTNTLLTKVIDSLTVTPVAGPDKLSCNYDTVSLGAIPKPGLVYSWAPATGLTNPSIANPLASPGITTNYILTTSNSGGGCRTTDTVLVKASVITDTLQVIGKDAFCFGKGDSAVLKVEPVETIVWFKDGIAISGSDQPTYHVNVAGNYSALLTNADGCSLTTRTKTIVIDIEKPGITYPVLYAIQNLPLDLNARKIGDEALWDPATSLDNPSGFTPVFKGFFDQLYTIEIRTNSGCLTVDTQLVKTVEKVEIYVPTGFTPNSDGRNDYLHPILRGVKEIRYFRVFNRWGQQVYEMSKQQPGWDGFFKGVPQPTQTVVWVLECIGLDGLIYRPKGASVLVR